MITAAELLIRYRSDTTDLERGETTAKRSLSGMASSAESAGRRLSLGLTAPIALAGAAALRSAAEAGQGQAQLAAALKSTDGASGQTVAGINALAQSLQKVTTFEDDAIVQGQNLLLTFTNIRNEAGAGNDVFDQSTKAILNVSAAMGKDLQSSAIMVGKALNDPIKGATALGRAGVQLTETQKKQIESAVKQGRTMDAQKIILAELETQFGGVAEAQAKTPWGKSQQAANNMGNAMEGLGNVLAPIVGKLSGWLSSISGWIENLSPGMKSLVVGILGVAAAVGPLLIVGAKLVTAFTTIKTAMAGLNLAFLANPFTILALAIVALVVIVVKNWDTIKRVLLAGLKAVVGFFTGAWDRIKAVTRAVWNGIKDLLVGIWNGIKSAAKAIWDAILGYFKWVLGLYKTVFSKAWEAILNAATTAWEWIRDAVVGAVRRLYDFVRGIPGKIVDFLSDLPGLLFEVGKNAIRGLLNGLKSLVTGGNLSKITNGIVSRVKDQLGERSPSRVFEEIGRNAMLGFNRGFAGVRPVGIALPGGGGLSGVSRAPAGIISAPSTSPGGGGRDLSSAFLRALETHEKRRRSGRTGELRERIVVEMDSREVAEAERRRALLSGEIV